jgi:PAS domain S-box-containing protein
MIIALGALITIALANVLIGLYVLRRNPPAAANRSFAFLAVAIAGWTLSIAFAHHGTLFLTTSTRLTFTFAALIPVAILFVFHTFPNEPALLLPSPSIILCVLSVTFSLLSLTPALVRSAVRPAHTLTVTYGPLHDLYGIYIVAALLWSFRIFLTRYLRASGLTKLQFRYFALGLLVPGIGVIITNLLIPLLSHSSRFGQYGPYFGLIFLALTAHVLIRYRFLDIRLVLRRGATVLLSLIASVTLLALLVVLLSKSAHLALPASHILLLTAGAATIGLSLLPLRMIFTRLFDAYAYRTQTDYPATLRKASDALTRILDMDSLAALTVRTLLQTPRAERVSFYLHTGSHLTLSLEQHYLDDHAPASPSSLATSSSLVQLLLKTHDPLVTEELARQPTQELAPIISQLNSHAWAVLVPILSENSLLGLIAVGNKLSGDPFFPEDIAFLSTFAGHTASAITNAQLYQQVLLINEYLQNILRTMESGVIAASHTGDITLFNAAAERMTGLPRVAAIEGGISLLPGPLRGALLRSIQSDRPQLQLETTLLDSHHRAIPVVCSTSPLRDNRAATVGAVLVFSDLTTLKHLEAQKQKAERLASLGALASGIAHEIKNPLVAIKTFAELLPDRFTDEEFREGFGRVVVSEIARIDELVAKLGGLAPIVVTPALPIDISDPLDDTLTLLTAQFEQHHIAVERQFKARYTHITGDAAQLKQLFLNILLNAIQSMISHGTLTVSLANDSGFRPTRVVIIFSDTGSGIPTPILPRIFEPFVTTKPLGSGLGLAICRNITDAHGATIRAHNNTSGPGASISLEFPIITLADPRTTDVISQAANMRPPVGTPSGHQSSADSR